MESLPSSVLASILSFSGVPRCLPNVLLVSKSLKRVCEAAMQEIDTADFSHETTITLPKLVRLRAALPSVCKLNFSHCASARGQPGLISLLSAVFTAPEDDSSAAIQHLDLSFISDYPEPEPLLELLYNCAPSLKSLNLSGIPELEPKLLAGLGPRFTQLKSLDLSHGSIRFGQGRNLIPLLRAATQLTNLDVSSAAYPLPITFADDDVSSALARRQAQAAATAAALLAPDVIPNLPSSLRRFAITDPAMGEASARMLVSRCPNLTHVDLSSSPNITDACVEMLASSLGSKLRSVKLRGCKKIGDPSIQSLARHCPHLEELCLSNAFGVTGWGLRELISTQKQRQSSARLRLLELKRCSKIDAETFTEHLLPHVGPSLLELDVTACTAFDDSAMHAVAQHCPGIRRLDVSQCPSITDDSVWAVAENCIQLRHLSLLFVSRTFSDMGLSGIGAYSANLNQLKLSFCEISDGGLASMVEALRSRNSEFRELHLTSSVKLERETKMMIARLGVKIVEA